MRRFTLAAMCLVCLLATAAGAQTLEDKVQEFTLDNGMKFLVVERPEAPVFFASIGFTVGSVDERPGIFGISHLLEHMLFKGTETLGTTDYKTERKYLDREDELAVEVRDLMLEIEPWRVEYFDEAAKEIVNGLSAEDREAVGTDRALEIEIIMETLIVNGPPAELAAVKGLVEDGGVSYFDMYIEMLAAEVQLRDVMKQHREYIISNDLWETYLKNGGRMLNAGTSNDWTVYFVALPENRLELWMLIESDRMSEPIFREFYTEKDVVMEELRMGLNDPEGVLYDSFLSTAYSASMYGQPVVGYLSDLKTITRPDLEAYYHSTYGPDHAVAVVVGDVDFDEVREMAEEYFGRIDPVGPRPPVVTNEPPQQGERRVVVKQDAKPNLVIGYHVPRSPHPDSYAIEVARQILSDGRSSRFYKSIYEEQGLTKDAPSAWSGPGNRLDPMFIVDASPTEPHTLEEVEAAVYAELDRLKTEEVDHRELERVWNADEAQVVRALGSNIWTGFRLLMAQATYGDWRMLMGEMERKRAVTPEDIKRVANKYFVEENRTVGWLVETASEDGEERDENEIDGEALMKWVQTLPDAERSELMNRFMSLDEAGREDLAKELWARMQAEKAKS